MDKHIVGAYFFVCCLFFCCFLFYFIFFYKIISSFLFFVFLQKAGFYISCKLSPLETICMNCQILFSICLLKFLLSMLSFNLMRHLSTRLVGFNDTSTLVDHFVLSPRERKKRDRRVVEEMKERDREERGTGIKVKKQRK